MRKMDAREYIENYETISYQISLKESEIERWKGTATGSTGSSEGERVQSSVTKEKMANAVVTYTDIEREVEALKEEQEAIKRNIQKLKGKQLYLIYRHYVHGVSIKAIASSLGMSPSWGTTTHARALASMQKILDAEGM